MDETTFPGSTRTDRLRRIGAAAGLVALVATAVVGGNLFGVRDRLFSTDDLRPRPAAVSRDADGAAGGEGEETLLRAHPWWQTVEDLSGAGPAAGQQVSIGADAIQWRVTWSCEGGGSLVVTAAGQDEPLVQGACPGTGIGYATSTGDVALDVDAAGSWELAVEQQVDVPLEEPPLPEMTAAGTKTAAAATFYEIDRAVTGEATLYRIDDGSYALRLDDFYVTPNVDLEIKLSPLKAPGTTREFMDAPSVFVAPLVVTAGSLNFEVPDKIDPTKYESIVIWCPPVASAYAGATLQWRR